MTLELWLMIVSGVGMIGMLTASFIERSKGVKIPYKDLSAKADPVLSSIGDSASTIASHITLRNAVVVLNHAFVLIVRFFIHLFREIHDFLHDIVERASKKTEDLSRSGAASFYLKKIKEGKDEARNS